MQKKWGKTVLVLLAFGLAGTFYCVEMHQKKAPVWENAGTAEAAETEQTEENGGLEMQQSGQHGEAQTQPEQTEESAAKETTKKETTIYVHICGAVQKPGVYEVPENYRLYELLEAAGGATDEGCADALNLADILQDGQRIVIPTASEAETMQTMTEYAASDGLVNINTASMQELMMLPGIGEAKAADIIQYREEYGEFQTINDIMKISGIKDALFQKIKDRITV